MMITCTNSCYLLRETTRDVPSPIGLAATIAGRPPVVDESITSKQSIMQIPTQFKEGSSIDPVKTTNVTVLGGHMPIAGDQDIHFENAALIVNAANPDDHPTIVVDGGTLRIDLSTLKMEFNDQKGDTKSISLYVSAHVEVNDIFQLYTLVWMKFQSEEDSVFWVSFDRDVFKLANINLASCIYSHRYV
jgi:hypothetical protein